MSKHLALAFFTLFGIATISNAQSNLAHEVGVIFGPVSMKSDYGQRDNFSTNIGNTGFGIGVVHFLNFSTNANHETFFGEHFKVRSEVSYSSAKLEHFGKWVEQNSNSLGVQQLKAMSGSSSILNFGTQLEFFPFMKIHDFENTIGSFNPYVSLGAQYNIYNAKASSSMGQLGDPAVTFSKYLTPSDGRPYGFSNETSSVFSLVAGAGTHFKLSPLQDLLFEVRMQYFGSDWVDGLNPNPNIYTENKSNDWQVWFNFGYVFYLQ